jgi:RND family efflux transporter MFP subunit
MSVFKQILLSIVVLAIAAGGWYAWDRNMIPFLPRTTVAAGGAAGAGGFPGGPGGFVGGPGGFGGIPGAPAAGGAAARAPAPIVAAAVTLDDDGFEVKAIGTAAASKAITIYPQVTGIVAEVSFKPGQVVTAGQTLIKLVDADQQVAQQKAKITLDAAQAAYDRAEQLAKANAVTAAALSDARTNLTKAQIDYQTSQLDVAKRVVTAPFAGTTGLSGVTVGDLATSNKAITTLDDVTSVLVAFDIPERASGKVAVGQEVMAKTEALPGKTFVGMISAVDSRVDATARTLRVEAKLPNDANVLKPGMAVAITMEFPGEMRPVVPSLSVQYDRTGAYVWRVENNVVKRVAVDVIDRRSGTVIVVANLKAGDLIASEGIQRLRENTRVNVVDDGSGGLPVAPSTPVAAVTPESGAAPTGVTGAPAGANRGGQGATGPSGGNRPQGPGGAGAVAPGAGGPAAVGPRGAGAGAGGTGGAGPGAANGPRPSGAGPSQAAPGGTPPVGTPTPGTPTPLPAFVQQNG